MPPTARGPSLVAPLLLVLLLCCSACVHSAPHQANQQALQQKQQQQKQQTQISGHTDQKQQLLHGAIPADATQQLPQQQTQHPAAPGALQRRTLLQQQHQPTPALKPTSGPSGPAAAPSVQQPSDPPAPFTIPVPAPGLNVPAEPLVPLYSPDQLRLRLPVLEDVPLDGQIISLMEQMQQAAHLNKTLTKEQLENANPLLGRHGVLKVPERTEPSQYPEGYVAICAIVKNQHKDLREWVEYHKWIGVQKIYIYDNNSTEPLSAAISDFLQSGFVEYSFFTGMPRYRDLFRTSSQWWAYNDCVTRFRHRHRWLAFIDADEFIVFHNTTEPQGYINTFIRGYDKYGGLALNWVVFGSSGHKQRPHGGVLVNYRQCLPLEQEQNQHVKVIANTGHLMTVGDDPHRVYYNDKHFYTVNELGNQVLGPKSPPSHTTVALYHYLTKSEGEYMQKMKRGSAAGNYKSPEFFFAINGLATSTCTRAIPLGLQCCPSVTKELGPAGVQRVQAAIAAGGQVQAPADSRAVPAGSAPAPTNSAP